MRYYAYKGQAILGKEDRTDPVYFETTKDEQSKDPYDVHAISFCQHLFGDADFSLYKYVNLDDFDLYRKVYPNEDI